MRSHNFKLGYESGIVAVETEYAEQMKARSLTLTGQGGSVKVMDVKKSNIELGSKWENNDYTSMQKMTGA